MRDSLVERGITFTTAELQQHFDSLKFDDNDSDSVSRLEVYANAHLLKVDGENTELSKRIAVGCGVGLTEEDLEHFAKFAERIVRLTDVGDDNNCSLLIDAE